MSENSKIEWTDHTFNPWEGCTKVSPGCDHCYAETRNIRFASGINWGAGALRRRTSTSNWKLPYKWNASADKFFQEHGRRQRVFCASLADVFDNEVDPNWRADLLLLIRQTPNLDWLLLTKRIGNVLKMVSEADEIIGRISSPLNWPIPNVWLGATIVNQEEANRDILKLLEIPVAVRFLSMEPLLGDVDITNFIQSIPVKTEHPSYKTLQYVTESAEDSVEKNASLNWIIVGGESGANARPMHPDWVRHLRDQCKSAKVPFFFKQWGEWKEVSVTEKTDLAEMPKARVCLVKSNSNNNDCSQSDDVLMKKVGKHQSGRLLDGQTHDETPT